MSGKNEPPTWAQNPANHTESVTSYSRYSTREGTHTPYMHGGQDVPFDSRFEDGRHRADLVGSVGHTRNLSHEAYTSRSRHSMDISGMSSKRPIDSTYDLDASIQKDGGEIPYRRHSSQTYSRPGSLLGLSSQTLPSQHYTTLNAAGTWSPRWTDSPLAYRQPQPPLDGRRDSHGYLSYDRSFSPYGHHSTDAGATHLSSSLHHRRPSDVDGGQDHYIPASAPLHLESGSSRLSTLSAAASMSEPLDEKETKTQSLITIGPVGEDGWQLSVIQQPERARLCSFKEENETIDKRPVDPPPVVRLIHATRLVDEIMACPVRLRAIVVSPAPLVTKALQELVPQDYEERRLAQGAVATTGETTQGLDKLQDLEGKFSAFGVFGKLSIRVPGIFRLRFELYETLSGTDRLLTACVTEPFQVYSPKQFKGMKESTPLTRHFASQGFKIKLRQESGVGRGGKKRKATDSSSSRTPVRPPRTQPPRDHNHNTTITSALPLPKPMEDGHDHVAVRRRQSRASSQSHPTPSKPYYASQIDSTSSSTSTLRPESPPGSLDRRAPGGDGLVGPDDEPSDGYSRRGSNPSSGKVSLPPIAKALKQSSVWFSQNGFDDLSPVSDTFRPENIDGGITFRDGIRYGGDDGGPPPMSFGRLPSLISEGIVPTTSALLGGSSSSSSSDLASFSLKNNNLVSLGTGFTPPAPQHGVKSRSSARPPSEMTFDHGAGEGHHHHHHHPSHHHPMTDRSSRSYSTASHPSSSSSQPPPPPLPPSSLLSSDLQRLSYMDGSRESHARDS